MNIAHWKFLDRIDWLVEVQNCNVYGESYIGIHVLNTNIGPMCMRCKRKGSNQIFLSQNHMDLGSQPQVM